jgi:C1A family cysteine protease
MVRIHRGNPDLAFDLSEAHLFFCLSSANNASYGDGWWPTSALAAYQATGVADEACFPYDAGANACNANSDWAKGVTKITGYQDLTNNPAAIKEWIANHGPVSACFYVYEDFFSYKSGVYHHVLGNLAGGHCVSIVGYDDLAGYWLCKNSWGTGWGDQGYFRIAYGDSYIDSWGVFGITGIEETGWRYNVRVAGLWTINQDRNAWAYLEGFGWREIASDNANIFQVILAQLIAAKTKGSTVSFYEEQSIIKKTYAF